MSSLVLGMIWRSMFETDRGPTAEATASAATTCAWRTARCSSEGGARSSIRIIPTESQERVMSPSSKPYPTGTEREPGAKILTARSEEHTSELQSPKDLVCRLLLEKKKNAVTAKHCESRRSNNENP